MKVALPVVRGLHGSRTEGTTRRFKVGDFKTGNLMVSACCEPTSEPCRVADVVIE